MKGSNHLDVVTGHDHLGIGFLGAVGEHERAGLISGADVHLRAVVLLEASVTTAFLLGKNVEREEELLMGSDGARGSDDHAAPDVLTLDATEKKTGVVTGAGLLAGFLEGLDIGDLGLNDLVGLANNLDISISLQDTTLDTARDDGATATNGEDVLNGEEERLVCIAFGGWDPFIDGLHELVDLALADFGTLALEGAEGRTHNDRCSVTVEAVGAEKLTHLHLNELQHLGVLESINLVDEDDNLLDTDLAGEEQMLTGLGHLTIRSGDDDDGTVHGGGTGNHVLDVIGVTGAVDVRVVAVFGRVLDVGSRDGDTPLALLGSLVDGAIVEEAGETLLGLSLGDSGGKGRLAVVDVTDGANVDVRLGALIDSVGAGEVEDRRPGLALEVHQGRDRLSEGCRPQKRGNCSEKGGHLEQSGGGRGWSLTKTDKQGLEKRGLVGCLENLAQLNFGTAVWGDPGS